MPTYRVWDEINMAPDEVADGAATIEAFDAEAAVLEYAGADTDGHTDDIYEHGQPIAALPLDRYGDPVPPIQHFEVHVEMVPRYRAVRKP